MPYELGVDLGTTFTAAAVRDGAEPTMLGLGNRALQVPSVLFRTDAGFLVGEAAERRGATEPRGLVREFKRRLGDPVPILVDGAPYSPELLSATLLRWVVDAAARRQGEPPSGLVLTHPASWGAYKLDVLRQVVTLAEVGEARWVPEPVAAAAQYASRTRVAVGERLAVYDLGGGTFDVCVLEKTEDRFVMLGPAEGVERLGGVDFDEAVFEQVRAALADRLADLDVDDPETVAGLARLRRECVEAKEALSVDAETTVPVALPGLVTSVRVTRTELEQLIRPAVDQSVRAMARAIRSAGLEPKDLSGIVLVGGSSRIPLVGEVLQRTFEVATALDTHPKHDVALGSLRSGATTSAPVSTASSAPTVAPPVVVPAPATVAAVPAAPAAVRLPEPDADPVDPPDPWAEAARNLPGADAAPVGRGPGRRWVIALVAAVLVVVLAVVVVPRLLKGSSSVAGPSPAPTTPSAPPSPGPTASPTPTPSPTPSSLGLPQSAPLAADQLLLGMESDGNVDLYLASTTSAAPVRRLTTRKTTDRSPVLSPDRRTMVYVNVADEGASGEGKRTLRVAGAADGSGDRLLVDRLPSGCRGSVSRAAWDPVRTDVVVVPCVDTKGRDGLYRIRLDGTVLNKVGQPEVESGDPAFSPDGSRLAFWSGPASSFDGGSLYVTSADGTGSPVRLTKSTTEAADADPVFSPDGTTIAFRRRVPNGTRGGQFDVFVMNADGSGTPRALTQTPGSDEQNPTYAPSGQQIAYKSNADVAGQADGVERVWVMGKDGADPLVLLTKEVGGEQTAPTWGHW